MRFVESVREDPPLEDQNTRKKLHFGEFRVFVGIFIFYLLFFLMKKNHRFLLQHIFPTMMFPQS